MTICMLWEGEGFICNLVVGHCLSVTMCRPRYPALTLSTSFSWDLRHGLSLILEFMMFSLLWQSTNPALVLSLPFIALCSQTCTDMHRHTWPFNVCWGFNLRSSFMLVQAPFPMGISSAQETCITLGSDDSKPNTPVKGRSVLMKGTDIAEI